MDNVALYLDEYTKWVIVNSIVWIAGCVMAIIILWRWDPSNFKINGEKQDGLSTLTRYILLTLSAFIALMHIADIVYPEPKAIHYILEDLRD